MRTLRQTLRDLGVTQDEAARLLRTTRENISRRADADLLDSLPARLALLAAGYLRHRTQDDGQSVLVKVPDVSSDAAAAHARLASARELVTALAAVLGTPIGEIPRDFTGVEKSVDADLTSGYPGITVAPMPDLEITRGAQDKRPIPDKTRLELVLPAPLRRQVDDAARKHNTSSAEIIRQVLVKWFEAA